MLFKCTIYNITRFDFEIYIDGTKIDDFQYISNEIHINCTLSKGLHHLKIVNNKKNNISKSYIKTNIIYINNVCYDLKFDINKNSSLNLNCVSKKIELENNHIHWRLFKCERNNVKIINESLNLGELCNIITKYGTKILLKDLGFVTFFLLVAFWVIYTMLKGFSEYGIVALIWSVVVFSGFGLYYLIKFLIKCYRYYTIIKKIKANKSDVSLDLLDWFIYDGRWGLRD